VGCGRKIGPYDCCTIITDDCLHVMAEIPDGIVKLIVTSPPYNNHENKRSSGGDKPAWRPALRNIEYGSFDDEMPEDEYQAWQQRVILEMLRIVKADGTVAYNHKNRIRNWGIISPLSWILPVANVRQEIVWDRGNSPQVSPVRFLPTTERVYLIGEGRPHFKPEHLIDKEVWHIPPAIWDGIPSFPEPLVERLIDALCPDNGLVADFFVGSGTTPAVARRMGHHFFGCDINSDMAERARERVRNTQPPLFVMQPEQLPLVGAR